MLEALIIDDDAHSRSGLAEVVESEGFEPMTAGTLEEAREKISDSRPAVVLIDLILPDGKGTEILEDLEDDPTVEVIMITGKATVETAIAALRLGAYDYLTKPVDINRLQSLLSRLKETLELQEQVSSLRAELRELGRFGPMVGTSEPMQVVYDLIDKVAPTDATVFLVGESGTGKELAALTLHQLSKRRRQSYLPLNCGAISPNLIESELFGHEKGSFTGANRQHKGYFERSSGGTIFLDEITEMPLEMQIKLLRVLETGRILRVGGDKEIEVDVRVIAATNRDPDQAVEEGKLREDLLYRLKVFPIELPPLRERGDDVELLAQHFLNELNEREERQLRFTEECMEQIRRHDWPGNVRELQNVVQRAFILAEDRIDVDCLPPPLKTDGPDGEEGGEDSHLEVRIGSSIDEVERRLILATLQKMDGDKEKTAEALGISVKTLYNRLNRYEQAEEKAS
ncbi:MAG: sigma-54 dependent transcriptional regulator [Thermoanaerobaculia bacterium]|nr:sigma-54 dependent transcriptional regulator [Thermoanaerobaculia bacterium]